MDNQPLVTMITYCYNGERFIDKYFEAILSQTYQNIELIFFNNGCEDNTQKIIEQYVPKLKDKGVDVNIFILEKNNPYTCELKQQAFKMMHGKYFFGCDSDDIIYPDYIEKMVDYLESHKDKGLVYCQLDVVNENGEITGELVVPHQQKDKEGFENIILARKTIYTAIGYMMSTEWFDKINPSREIFISKFGENYQCQMPFLYNNLQGYVDEKLGSYLVRSDSYSGQLTREKHIMALTGQEETLIETLKNVCLDDFEKWKNLAVSRIRKDKFYLSLKTGNNELVIKYFKELKTSGFLSIKEILLYIKYKLIK